MNIGLNRGISTPVAIIIVVICSLVIGGLVFWQYKEAKETKPPEEKLSEKKSREKEIVKPSEKVADICKDVQNQEKRDKCYLELALESRNESYCSEILTQDCLLNECRRFGQIHCLECLAALKNDSSICPSESYNCPEYVFLQNTELCEDIKIDVISRCRSCYLGNLTSEPCELENSKLNEKIECIKDIAIETEDFELCKKVDKTYKGPYLRSASPRSCQNELAVKLNKPEMCTKTWTREWCLEELAKRNKDVALCKKATSYVPDQVDCITDVALSRNDSNLCQELAGKEYQDECYYKLGIEAGIKGSCQLCEKFVNETTQRLCFLKMATAIKEGELCKKLDTYLEDSIKKYTDEEFGFSFYYPKASEISGDIFLTGLGPYGYDSITITKYQGQRVEDKSAKFGEVAYYYDEGKDQWMKERHGGGMGEKEGIYPAEPGFYTLSGLPVFGGVGRWATSIVALSTDKFLIINISGSGWTSILGPLVRTVMKTGQEVEDKELKRILAEEILINEERFFKD